MTCVVTFGMFYACACYAVAHLVQTRVELPVQYRRPSSIVGLLSPAYGPTLVPADHVVAEDSAGKLAVVGTPAEIDTVRQFVQLVDHPRQRLMVSIDVHSKVDHMHYKVDAEIYPGQGWSTFDKELDLRTSLMTRLNDDGSATLKVVCIYRNRETDETFRLGLGKSTAIAFPGVPDESSPEGSFAIAPAVTVKYMGRKGD